MALMSITSTLPLLDCPCKSCSREERLVQKACGGSRVQDCRVSEGRGFERVSSWPRNCRPRRCLLVKGYVLICCEPEIEATFGHNSSKNASCCAGVSSNVLTCLKFVAKPGDGLHLLFKELFITSFGLLLFCEAPLGHRKRQVGNPLEDLQVLVSSSAAD